MKKQAKKWLNAANDDLKVIEKIIDDETLTNNDSFSFSTGYRKISQEYFGRI